MSAAASTTSTPKCRPQSAPAGTWIQARDFAAIENVPNWNDWSIRTAVAYDLFGNGKTALKANASKYIASAAAGYAAELQRHDLLDADTRLDRPRPQLQHPRRRRQHPVRRGARRDVQLRQITSRPDPDLARGYNWEYNASVQHELVPRLSVTAGYYRRAVLQPGRHRQHQPVARRLDAVHDRDADRPAAASCPAQPITHLQPEHRTRSASPTDNLRTFSSINTTTYNGFEVERQRAPQQAAAVRRHHGRSACHDRLRRHDTANSSLRSARHATTRTGCGSAIRFRRSARPGKLSAAYQLP